MDTTRSLELCERYFDAWQRHDADAVVALAADRRRAARQPRLPRLHRLDRRAPHDDLLGLDDRRALSAAMREGTHARAMRELLDGELAEAALTGVYAPLRVGPAWRRCRACAAMVRIAPEGGACRCGAALAALL